MSGPVRSFASGGQWRVLTGDAFNTTPPSPPFIASAVPSNDTLTVTLGAPLSNGGSAITGYTVSAVPVAAGIARTVSGAGPSLSVSGLTVGLSYKITAYATNAIGNGGTSAETLVTMGTATFVKPSAYNTGYPHGLSGDTRTPVSLTPIDADDFVDLVQATSGNTTISGYDVIGGFSLRRENITFQNCRFSGVPETTSQSGSPYITAGGSPQPTTVTFIDCEFAGNGVAQNDPDGDLTLGWAHSLPCNIASQRHIRSNIWGFIDGMHAIPNTRYESCYIHDLTFFYTPTGETHNDGFQFVGDANNFVMVGCNVDVAAPHVNAVMQYNGGSTGSNLPRTQMTLDSNWFNGGGFYCMSGAPNVAGEDLSMVISNNRFGLQCGSAAVWYPHSGWTDAMAANKLTVFNNVWETTGTTSAGVAVVAGQLIPNPGDES